MNIEEYSKAKQNAENKMHNLFKEAEKMYEIAEEFEREFKIKYSKTYCERCGALTYEFTYIPCYNFEYKSKLICAKCFDEYVEMQKKEQDEREKFKELMYKKYDYSSFFKKDEENTMEGT